MNIKMRNLLMIFPIVAAVLGLGTLAVGQTVGVTPKKIVYRRPKPEIPFKRTFSITYPKISGATPEIKKRIEAALDYEKVFEFTIKEERTEIQWLEYAEYKVLFNRGGILSVALTISGTGAYPSSTTKNLNIDTKTGEKISVVDQIKYGAQDAMMGRLNGLLKAEVAKYTKMYKNPKYEVEDPESLFGESVEFTLQNVEEFTVGPRGITFYYDYGFPHVIQALQPPGQFLLRWSEFRNYIKDSSVFGQLAK